MLSRRSSYKNQTCIVLKKSSASPNQMEIATPTAPLPHSQSSIPVQRTNNFSHQDYDDQSAHPLSCCESAKFAQRTYSVGLQEHSHDQKPLPRTQSNSVGSGHHNQHVQKPLPHFQSTQAMNRTTSMGHQEYGHDLGLKPLPRTQTTKVTSRTNSMGHQEHGRTLGLQPVVPSTQPTKVTQRTNKEYGQTTMVTQRINSLGGHHHGPKMPVQKKPVPTVEFPVSPDLETLVVGEGITNVNHPQHTMVQVNVPTAFTCMGCKEYGAGTRFTCQQCNFELHDYCALAPPVLKAHPLHSQHQLLFSPKPGKAGLLRSKCDVCAKSEKGYMFRCSACSFQLHPTCAMLSAKMNFPTHPHPLVILPASANSLLSGDLGDLPCAECKRKRSGQVYRCTVCDYYLHAVCAKNMVNGLHVNGIKGLDKPSMLGVAAKIASHVVVGFMGGLFEGIGEGLGEALTQNFAKGRCNSTRKSLYPGN